jgi:septal ring factor EnvC (AmiA/AmiB activator)
MDSEWIVPALMIAGSMVVPAIGGLLVTLTQHREKMAQLQSESKQDGQRIAELEARLEKLEKLSAKLDERVTDAHVLLADEQRELDTKLNRLLPPIADAGGDDSAKAKAPRERVGS